MRELGRRSFPRQGGTVCRSDVDRTAEGLADCRGQILLLRRFRAVHARAGGERSVDRLVVRAVPHDDRPAGGMHLFALRIQVTSLGFSGSIPAMKTSGRAASTIATASSQSVAAPTTTTPTPATRLRIASSQSGCLSRITADFSPTSLSLLPFMSPLGKRWSWSWRRRPGLE